MCAYFIISCTSISFFILLKICSSNLNCLSNIYFEYFRTVNGISSDGLKSKSGPKRPRRKFPWNEEFRYTYCVIYNHILVN